MVNSFVEALINATLTEFVAARSPICTIIAAARVIASFCASAQAST